jgi:hypothetical protein
MKSTRLLVIVLVVGLLAAYYFLGTDYGKQRRRQASLSSQISTTAQQLALIPPAPTDLEPRLAAANADLDTAKNAFSPPPDGIGIVNAVLQLADAAGVKAVPLITQTWSMASVNQTDYPVFRLNIAATGTFTKVSDFISRLENGEPETLVISDLKIERVTGPPAPESGTGGEEPVEASLDIAVYGRPSVTVPSPEDAR